MKTRKLVVVYLLAVAAVSFRVFPIAASLDGGSHSLSAFFVLGDSSVDCGDNTFFSPFIRGNLSPYLCNDGDRKLIPDILAEKMGIPPPPRFYSQNGTLEGLIGGLNFGSSPATIMSYGRWGFQGLNQQARQVFETLQLLQLQLGLESANRLIRSSLFYIAFGKDDYIQYLHRLFPANPKLTSIKFASMLASQTIRVIKDLYHANVRKVVCAGIGPLGCTPRSLWEDFNSTGRVTTNGSCIREINELVTEYNGVLFAALQHLNSELPDAQIIFCDVYPAMMEVIGNPQIHGFWDVSSACCGVGMYGGLAGCVAKAIACAEPSKHAWWDLYNPSEAVNVLLADWMWSGRERGNVICRPINIERLASSGSVAPT